MPNYKRIKYFLTICLSIIFIISVNFLEIFDIKTGLPELQTVPEIIIYSYIYLFFFLLVMLVVDLFRKDLSKQAKLLRSLGVAGIAFILAGISDYLLSGKRLNPTLLFIGFIIIIFSVLDYEKIKQTINKRKK